MSTTEKDIVKSMRILSGMIQMGDRIAFGLDSRLLGDGADEIERLRIHIAELEAAQAWRPIETAPQRRAVIVRGAVNGYERPQTTVARYWPRHSLEMEDWEEGDDRVDVADDTTGYAQAGWYEENNADEACLVCVKPTHWLPLPSPPSDKDGTNEI